jgi:hypothetical protein
MLRNIKETLNGASLNEIFQKYSQGDRSSYKDYELLENERIKLVGLDNVPVNKKIFQYSYGNQKVRVLAYKMINSGSLYNILFYAPAETFDDYLPVIEEMINSLRFIPDRRSS